MAETKIFHYVIVSKDEQFSFGTKEEILALQSQSRKIDLVSSNSKPLPKVFNEYLQAERETSYSDFLVFMHADVKVNLDSLESHTAECSSKYDVMGLCGTSIMNVSQSPLNWWTGSNPTPQSKWGCVTHGELGNQTSFFNQHSPDARDHEVACIDGLCMIFTKKAIHETAISFDEKFEFDFYDTDISFQCVMQYKLKLGVIVEKSLQHYSVGKSILTEDFLKHEIDFRQKWNLEIPSNSPILTKFRKS